MSFNLNQDNENFRMDDNYEHKSASQYSIGIRVLTMMEDYIKSENLTNKKILDVGCGPGHITNKLFLDLKEQQFQVTGLDIDQTAITNASKKYPDVHFIRDNIHKPHKMDETYDFIYSNEVLHWMSSVPKLFMEQDSIIYYFFDEEMRQRYEKWGRKNYLKAFTNIYELLNPGGIAFLQFGTIGQLYNIFKSINDIISTHFPNHVDEMIMPLLYLPFNEIESLAKAVGFTIVKADVYNVDLVEKTPEELVSFIEGWTSHYFRAKLGEEKTEELYGHLLTHFENSNMDQIIAKQWFNTVLVLSKS